MFVINKYDSIRYKVLQVMCSYRSNAWYKRDKTE